MFLSGVAGQEFLGVTFCYCVHSGNNSKHRVAWRGLEQKQPEVGASVFSLRRVSLKLCCGWVHLCLSFLC